MLFKESISNSPNIKSRGVPLRISKLWITAASTILNHKTAIPQMTNHTNTQNVVPGGKSPPPTRVIKDATSIIRAYHKEHREARSPSTQALAKKCTYKPSNAP